MMETKREYQTYQVRDNCLKVLSWQDCPIDAAIESLTKMKTLHCGYRPFSKQNVLDYLAKHVQIVWVSEEITICSADMNDETTN